MKKIILMLTALTFMTGSAFACGQQPEKKEMTEQTKKECTNENNEQSETNTETAETETQVQ